MKIIVNAASAGSGKTFNSKNVIRLKDKEKFLVIVPSINLANEYADVGTVIHSENATDSVSAEVFANLDKRVIIITHKAFLLNKFKHVICGQRHIIQDEEMTVYSQFDIRLKIHLPWKDMFTYTPSGRWFKLTPNLKPLAIYLADADTMDNTEVINQVLHTPQVIYILSDDLETAQTAYQYISPDIFNKSKSITLNSANFKNLMQYHIWKNMFGVEFEFAREFVKYDAPNLQFYNAEQKYNSITYNKDHEDIRAQVISFTQKIVTTNPLIYVDNNNFKKVEIPNWTRIKHNAHGLNAFSQVEHIAFLSAINLNNTLISYITEHVEITADQLRNATLGEMAHQIIMRGSLRNGRNTDRNNKCNVFLMEKMLTWYLMSEVFNCPMNISIPNTEREEKSITRITQADTNKALAIRNMFPEKYITPKKYSVHELMALSIWNFTSARGKILKHLSEFWDAQGEAKWYS